MPHTHRAGDGEELGGGVRPAAERDRHPPEAAYLWVQDSILADWATVTVVTEASVDEVLRAFGADPGEPIAMRVLEEDPDPEPWVAVLPVDSAVLAVEVCGWRGTQADVLRRASARGRAGSMSWNLSGKSTLSCARAGTLLYAILPPPYEPPDDAELRVALDGLNLDDYHDWEAKGLAAIQRVTGYALHPDDVERIDARGIGYRIGRA
jgi:hypothetical protein